MLKLSPLNKTWILDIDGTIVKHKKGLGGKDELLEGVKEFFSKIPKEDMIVFITSRKEQQIRDLEVFLTQNDIRFDSIICGAPFGERILINDIKPSGLRTAFAVNKNRDDVFSVEYGIDNEL